MPRVSRPASEQACHVIDVFRAASELGLGDGELLPLEVGVPVLDCDSPVLESLALEVLSEGFWRPRVALQTPVPQSPEQ